jgi:hypothetical protein
LARAKHAQRIPWTNVYGPALPGVIRLPSRQSLPKLCIGPLRFP